VRGGYLGAKLSLVARIERSEIRVWEFNMVRYRRNFVAGGTFFFTVTLADRASQVLTDHIVALRTSIRQTRSSHPFAIDAVAVLPDHLHMMMTLPDGDADYSNRWRLIKRRFTGSRLALTNIGRAPPKR
jgi:putative transposase